MRLAVMSAALLALAGCISVDVDEIHADHACGPQAAERAASEVMSADAAFSALAQQIGVREAFARYAADDAVMFDGETQVDGAAGVAALFADWPAGAQLVWAPVTARGSSCGDMAWTWGRSTYTAPGGASFPGRYVTVWKKNRDGEWRFGFDAALRPAR